MKTKTLLLYRAFKTTALLLLLSTLNPQLSTAFAQGTEEAGPISMVPLALAGSDAEIEELQHQNQTFAARLERLEQVLRNSVQSP